MKSFSEKLTENIKPFEDKDIRSIIYDIIDKKLSLNNTDNELSISGKEELTEKIFNLMSTENLKETIDTYKEVYDNPNILQEEVKKPKIIKNKATTIEKEEDDLEKDEKKEKIEDEDEKI